METRLKNYVYAVFEGAPKTRRTTEVRDEICANVLERYRDQLAAGKTPEEAYEAAKASIGSMEELASALDETPDVAAAAALMQAKRRSSAFRGIAVALYILSPVCLIALAAAGGPVWIGLVALFALVAVATGLMIYASGLRRDEAAASYQAFSDKDMAEFREWQLDRDAEKHRKDMISGILWPLVAAVYFLVSFLTGAWGITWIIWIIGAAVEPLITLLSDKSK